MCIRDRSDIASDVTKNVFYWSRVAVIVAQGSGMHRRYVTWTDAQAWSGIVSDAMRKRHHPCTPGANRGRKRALSGAHHLALVLTTRSVENSQLSKGDKRLWKRIWWTLFTRDRSVAVALGRPVSINIEDLSLIHI